MGVSYYVYVGPAVVCDPFNVKTLTCNKGVCIHCQVSVLPKIIGKFKTKNKDHQFCSKCGNSLYDISFHDFKIINKSEVSDKIEDVLCPLYDEFSGNKNHIFIPNTIRNSTRTFRFDVYHDGVIFQPIDIDLINKDIEWFNKNYYVELQKIKSIYGEPNCKVEFVFCTEIC